MTTDIIIDLDGLDQETIDALDRGLTPILEKLKRDDPERYNRSLKKAREENGNGGTTVVNKGRSGRET